MAEEDATRVLGEYYEGYGREVLCPSCGFNYTHPYQVDVRQLTWKATISGLGATVSKYRNEPGHRGSEVVVHFYCEGGCTFTMTMVFHKGMTYFIRTVGAPLPISERDGTPVAPHELERG